MDIQQPPLFINGYGIGRIRQLGNVVFDPQIQVRESINLIIYIVNEHRLEAFDAGYLNTLLEPSTNTAQRNATQEIYTLWKAHHSRDIELTVERERLIAEEARQRQAAEEHSRFVSATIDHIHQLLTLNRFDEADEKYAQVKDEYSKETYLKLVNTYRNKQARENHLLSLRVKLDAGDYPAADSLFHSSKLIGYEEYLRIKSPYIQKFVQNHYSKTINLEKAQALASTRPNLLLSARAGSGKTMVLASKASMLIECEQVHPDHILVMTFNRSAADEIRNRIRREYKQPGFENARTFHSLAHQLVRPAEDLLYDENNDIVTRKMTLFVQQLLKEQIRNPVFIEKMYEFFRKEMREIESSGFFLEKEAYFDFRRNLLQVTLNGERVKSVGEKIIADFLFEHDICYGYEKVWLWGSQLYRPDFSIYEQQKDYVIEHWGIDENDPAKQVPPDWSQTWEDYYAEMQAKRAFWRDKTVVLIETSIRDLWNGREAFEAILNGRLAQVGINKPKLTSAELLHKIRDKDYTITRLSELFTQFIQRAKKQVLKAQDVQKLMWNYQPKDDREAVFLDLACRVYMEYEQALTHQQKVDFDDLMMRAINKVHETKGDCEISLGNPKNRTIRMNDLRWILIDEYQDFSELFSRLITAIQHNNPRVQLFCVGDDWQAINGFAGSDLRFFKRFGEWVKDAQVAYLLTNFRSQAAIVQTGNALMQGYGRPGENLPQNNGGDVHIGYMDDVWIELRNNEATTSQKMDDERFLITEAANGNNKKYNRIVASKYLKKCYQIITSPENQGKSIAILSRTNWIDGVRLNDFKNRLIACFTPTDLQAMEDPKNKIDVQTAHKYKGLEADLVIILGACDGAFPLLHPDNALFEIFGKTLMDAFDEERRLFYVALTRAKSSLYILTEKGRESVFLKRLTADQPDQMGSSWTDRSSQFASSFFDYH
jgi:DNA helicase-4